MNALAGPEAVLPGILTAEEALSIQPAQISPGDTEQPQIVLAAALQAVAGAAIEGLAGKLKSNGYQIKLFIINRKLCRQTGRYFKCKFCNGITVFQCTLI